MRERLSREDLRRIIDRHGGVDRFAPLVPVEPRTVGYWLAGRKMHPVFVARVRAMAADLPNDQETPTKGTQME